MEQRRWSHALWENKEMSSKERWPKICKESCNNWLGKGNYITWCCKVDVVCWVQVWYKVKIFLFVFNLQVKFDKYSAEDCSKRWQFVSIQQRQYRVLSEILDDAVFWSKKETKPANGVINLAISIVNFSQLFNLCLFSVVVG